MTCWSLWETVQHPDETDWDRSPEEQRVPCQTRFQNQYKLCERNWNKPILHQSLPGVHMFSAKRIQQYLLQTPAMDTGDRPAKFFPYLSLISRLNRLHIRISDFNPILWPSLRENLRGNSPFFKHLHGIVS